MLLDEGASWQLLVGHGFDLSASPAAGRMGDTMPLHTDALKQIKPCKVIRNILLKKLQIGK